MGRACCNSADQSFERAWGGLGFHLLIEVDQACRRLSPCKQACTEHTLELWSAATWGHSIVDSQALLRPWQTMDFHTNTVLQYLRMWRQWVSALPGRAGHTLSASIYCGANAQRYISKNSTARSGPC